MENESPSVAQADPKPSETILGWMESVLITVSQTVVGQALLKLVDRFLWVVEKTTQWSLPCPETVPEENGKSFGKMELVRPLPWILFLPSLVVLRAVRIGLNVAAFVTGYPPIQPSGMVKFVQKGRRRLRALNLKAVKTVRRKTYGTKDKRVSMVEAKKALIRSIRLTLSTMSCLDNTKSSPSPPPTKIHISGLELTTATTPDEKSTTESAGSPVHTEAKRKYSEMSTDESEDEPLESKIERFAMEESADDLDFNPADHSTESSSESEEEEEEDVDVSLTELEDVRREAMTFLAATESQALQPPEIKEPEGEKRSAERTDESPEPANPRNDDTVGFYSPTKLSQDGDMTYYSPISSKSGSPEPLAFPSTEREPYGPKKKTIDFLNGEVSFNSDSTLSGTSKEEVTNGVVSEKRSGNTGRQQHHYHHHKGKRSNHDNRKKK